MSDVAHRVRDVFDDWAKRGRAEGMERGHGPTAQRAFQRLEVRDGTSYLDIGCGNGYTVRWAAGVAPGVVATGIDVSSQMIERARQQSAELANTSFICDTFPSGQLTDNAFDAVFSMEVFYYFDDLHKGLSAVHQLLKPGGRFACVVDFYRENTASHEWPELMDLPLHLLSEAEWRDAFTSAGIEVVDQQRLLHPLAPGEEQSWKHTEGSLMTLGRRPS